VVICCIGDTKVRYLPYPVNPDPNQGLLVNQDSVQVFISVVDPVSKESLDPDLDPEFGSRRAQMTHKNRKNSKLQFLIKKDILKIFSCTYFFQFLVIKTPVDPDPDSLEMLDRTRISILTGIRSLQPQQRILPEWLDKFTNLRITGTPCCRQAH
jgi:hypothetical protein